jgi:NADH-quinone oxidoreductase subunit L
MWALDNIWWVPILPLIGAIANGVFGKLFSKRMIAFWAVGSTGASFVIAASAFWQFLHLPHGAVYENVLFTWIKSGSFVADAGIQIDPLSGLWLMIVTGVGFLIHVYSIGYMHHEDGYSRYFAYLNLFMFSMLLLVLGNNYLIMFIGWEGVGLCSYLLIGYYYDKKSAADAGKKAFVMNRIGDFAFLLAVMWIFWIFGSIDYTTVFAAVPTTDALLEPTAVGGITAVTLITLLLFIGATGKSAQLPLYTWLPDAMEGPTPVSALIHAATMVTAGIYMVARSATLFNLAPMTMAIVALIGAATAIFAASMGLFQNDIKRVLAYSTVSQLGYMFLALGVGAYVAAAFHVMTHAFFKACLFLGSGSVIHGMSGEQDMRQMGGLNKLMPTTHWTFLVSTVAIAGIFPFAGFFSKDEILISTYFGHVPGHFAYWVIATVAAGITAFYMFRLYFMTFSGELRAEDHHVRDHVHESPASMTVPLIILAGLATVGGFLGLPAFMHLFGPHFLANFLHPVMEAAGTAEHPHIDFWTEIGMAGFAMTVGLVGIAMAWFFYRYKPAIAARMAKATGPAALPYWIIQNKYFVDEIYDFVIVRPFVWVSDRFFWKIFDVKIIDGIVNLIGSLMLGASSMARTTQTGYTRSYATAMVVGGALLIYYWVSTLGN